MGEGFPSLLQIPFGTEASYNNKITTKYNKRGKEHIYMYGHGYK